MMIKERERNVKKRNWDNLKIRMIKEWKKNCKEEKRIII